MKRNCLIAAIAVLLGYYTGSAQSIPVDSLKMRYDEDLIHFTKGYPAKGKNGERLSIREMKQEFAISPDALDIYAKAARQRTTSIVLISAGLASFLASGLTANANHQLARNLAITGGILYIAAIPFALGSSKNAHQAVWMRNRDVLLAPVKKK